MRCRSIFYPLLILCSGCSVHPLPSSENGQVPINDIVHRVQCEAAAAVKQMHASKGFTSASKEIDRVTSTIKTIKDKIADDKKTLEKSDFGTRWEELEDAGRSVLLRSAQIDLALEKNKTSAQTPEEEKLAQGALTIEKQLVRAQARNLVNSIKAWRAIDKWNDEIAEERKKLKPFSDVIRFEGHAAVFQFELEVTEDNNLSSTGSVAWPTLLNGLAGSFTVGYDLGDKRQRLAKRTVKLASTFDELLASFDPIEPNTKEQAKLTCLGVVPAAPDRFPRRYPITGNIGLAEVFGDYIEMLKNGKFKSGGESYQDKIQFTTTINGALKPGIDLARKPGPTIKVSADMNASRKDLHIVTVFLTPPGDGDKEGTVQNLVITSMPAVRLRGDIIRVPP